MQDGIHLKGEDCISAFPDSNNANPFFSIIVPVYNVENYLRECVESILGQSYGNHELLLIDDGSTDSSGKILDEFGAAGDGRIRVFHKTNSGLLATRMYGIDRAAGDFIVSVDSDDYLRADALELIYNEIIQHNADMILFNYTRDSDFSASCSDIQLAADVVLEKEELYKQVVEGPSLNNLVTKVFRRNCSADNNFLSQYLYVKNGEDLLQSLEPITKCKRIVFLNEPLYFYRVNQGSITKTFQKGFYRSISGVGMALRKYACIWDEQEGGGSTKWLQLVYNRNLKTCIFAIKYYRLNCEDTSEFETFLSEIKADEFYISSNEYADKNTFSIIEKMWLSCVEGNQMFSNLYLRLYRIKNRKMI